VVPAVFGALLLLAGSRGSSDAGSERVHAAQLASPSPLFAERSAVPTTTGPPVATEAGEPTIDPAETTTVVAVVDAAAETQEAAQQKVSTGPAAGATSVAVAEAGTSGPTSGPTTTTAAATTAPATAARGADPTTTTMASTTTTTPTTVAVPAGPSRLPSVEAELLPLTNADRTAQGLGALTRNACMDTVASGYAKLMAGSGVMAHNPAAGPDVTACRPGASWGDNVGTTGPCSAKLLEEAWMASPSHRHNILTGSFQQVGFGAWADANGSCWVQVLFSS
jgi:uncharacterized protein YkwD